MVSVHSALSQQRSLSAVPEAITQRCLNSVHSALSPQRSLSTLRDRAQHDSSLSRMAWSQEKKRCHNFMIQFEPQNLVTLNFFCKLSLLAPPRNAIITLRILPQFREYMYMYSNRKFCLRSITNIAIDLKFQLVTLSLYTVIISTSVYEILANLCQTISAQDFQFDF